MKYLRRFLQFWYDFIVGDDWGVAAAVVLVVVAAAALGTTWNVWPLVPLGTAAALLLSLLRAARSAHPGPR